MHPAIPFPVLCCERYPVSLPPEVKSAAIGLKQFRIEGSAPVLAASTTASLARGVSALAKRRRAWTTKPASSVTGLSTISSSSGDFTAWAMGLFCRPQRLRRRLLPSSCVGITIPTAGRRSLFERPLTPERVSPPDFRHRHFLHAPPRRGDRLRPREKCARPRLCGQHHHLRHARRQDGYHPRCRARERRRALRRGRPDSEDDSRRPQHHA